MEAVLFAIATAAGITALWWRQLRPPPPRQLASAFDGDAEVVLHVAQHEARARDQALSSLHLLYGLLQDETITAAIREAGHDPEAVEDRVLRVLEEQPADEPDLTREIEYACGRAWASAAASERKAGSRDLWAYLSETRAEMVLEAAGVPRVAVLFRLCHGAEPPTDAPGGDVHVVLRNDDFTTRDFVEQILARCFGLPPAEAHARMMQTHTEGRAVVGRFGVAEARAKIREVRELAREQGHPLWIGIEPI